MLYYTHRILSLKLTKISAWLSFQVYNFHVYSPYIYIYIDTSYPWNISLYLARYEPNIEAWCKLPIFSNKFYGNNSCTIYHRETYLMWMSSATIKRNWTMVLIDWWQIIQLSLFKSFVWIQHKTMTLMTLLGSLDAICGTMCSSGLPRLWGALRLSALEFATSNYKCIIV